jgi:hypothetical protein
MPDLPAAPPADRASRCRLEEDTPMITDMPMAAAAQFDDIANRVKAFIVAAKDAATDGITWAEFGQLFVALLRLSIYSLDTMTNLTGAEKKEIAIHAVAVLFDMVADKAVPAYVYPLWLLVRSPVRSILLAVAAGAVEVLLPMVRALAS